MQLPSLISLLSSLSALAALAQASAGPSHGLHKRRLDKRCTRTKAPSGAVVVAQDGSGEFATIQAAVDSGATSIFVQPGTYEEQVYVEGDGVAIYGYTENSDTFAGNQVVLTHSLSANDAENNDATGTLRVHGNDFKLCETLPAPSLSSAALTSGGADNVDVVNSYGKGSQALALSAYGERQGFYGSRFYGYQDTILTNEGTQYFSRCYVEGATDFIFGQRARSFFDHSTLAIVGMGYIVAPGRDSEDGAGLYVFNSCSIEQAASAPEDLTGQAYLGRPWRNYARAVYKYCSISSVINAAGWKVWNADDERTDNILFGEYENSGDGAWNSARASFATQLDSAANAEYTLSSVLGSDYASWVDGEFLA
ncbi:hypothetical protein JCM6882_000691 [Rhodosporidiobolus microsporus]